MPISVESQVFDLMVCLVQTRDHVVSKEDLIAAVWGGRAISVSTFNSRINAARTALGDSGRDQELIRTIPRKGLRFVGALSESNTARPDLERPPSAMPLPDRPAIAVLPFNNMSGEGCPPRAAAKPA
jgi:DNA-binding winged helix-turn-helix (wHTH) protein